MKIVNQFSTKRLSKVACKLYMADDDDTYRSKFTFGNRLVRVSGV